MKFWLFSTLIASLAISCWSYSFLIPAKISHPGICFYHGLLLKPGDNALPSSCQNMHCNDDGSILVQGCGHYELNDCRVIDPTNLDKPYPDCCKMNFLCNLAAGQQQEQRQVSPLDRKIYS